MDTVISGVSSLTPSHLRHSAPVFCSISKGCSVPVQVSYGKIFNIRDKGRNGMLQGCLPNLHLESINRRSFCQRSRKQLIGNATSGQPLGSEPEAFSTKGTLETVQTFLDAFYRFSRPHTVIGTTLSIISVSLLAVESISDFSPLFLTGLLEAVVAALFMNIYIVGLNQLYDIEIDKVNKPNLPLASGEYSVKTEFRVMASALSKEMEMMELQLNRFKELAHEALSLHGEAHSLKALLDTKMSEHKSLSDRCSVQTVEIESLKALIENLQKEKQKLQIFLDMYGQECFDNRDVMEIKESERRARAQAKMYQTVLDEHSLELRVKAAKEAEAACQQRLSAAEAEISDLRAKVDASERQRFQLSKAKKIKDGEAKAYMSEIETIGQAYEDMQTQNLHLLQQITKRDDYNIKLVSESVKTKQAQSSLLFEKQAISKQLQQVKASLDYYKQNIARNEEQMKASLTQAAKISLENRHVFMKTENAKLELANAEKELKWLRSAVDSSEKEYEQNHRKMVQLRKELEDKRAERKKMEEELVEWNSKVTEMSSENREATIQRLQDEIKECKAILKCGVCFDRPKEVVITKCYHLFCYPCIQRNLEIRHRKCPGCGTPFGQNDVREVKI